jgi:hypothetical protein
VPCLSLETCIGLSRILGAGLSFWSTLSRLEQRRSAQKHYPQCARTVIVPSKERECWPDHYHLPLVRSDVKKINAVFNIRERNMECLGRRAPVIGSRARARAPWRTNSPLFAGVLKRVLCILSAYAC